MVGLSTRLGTLTLVLGLATMLSAADRNKANLDPNGRPPGFDAGDSIRYGVWHDQRGWHVCSTTEKKKHRFRGQIEVVGGTFEAIHSVHLEKDGKTGDKWKVESQRRTITFDFETDGVLDGITFRVSRQAKEIRFRLHIDGKERPERVFVGHRGEHPSNIPFTLPAHPGRK